MSGVASRGEIEFVPLAQVDADRIAALMNLEAVRRHLPLLQGAFSAEDAQDFLAAKQALWDEHGFGPSAIMIGGVFAGWGGLQPERGDADFALVLHPDFWGYGRRIFHRAKDDGFGRLGLPSITILLPPGRASKRVVARLGFVKDGVEQIGGAVFERFRLSRPAGV